MNAMMGILSVFFAYQGRIREAYFILIGAALFDKLDGALARKLGLTEPIDPDEPARRINLGGILDDISDAVSFCVVPAWIFYIFLSQIAEPGFYKLPFGLISICYIILGISRLIYFTLDTSPIPGFFKGLPTPAAALLVVAPMTILEQSIYSQSNQVLFWGRFCFGAMIVTSLTMNFYPIRYIHYGRFMNRHPVFVGFTFFIALILVFTPYFGHFALLCTVTYLISPLWTWRVTPDVAARETRI
jgi:phosphatidylserine synthase